MEADGPGFRIMKVELPSDDLQSSIGSPLLDTQ
jgi:hypothetical protein